MNTTLHLEGIRDEIFPLLAQIKILIVMDGRIGTAHYASFGPGDQGPRSDYFGLSEVISTLTGFPKTFSRFIVTKAHRDKDIREAADIEGFRFDQHNLSVYDEIWLIGLATSFETDAPMTDSELAALTTFMDGGGGVFATGDHEDLGVALNGRVPRVRSMRKWFWPAPGPNGEPVAPESVGVDRHDTTQPGHNDNGPAGTVLFDDQSDDVPQPLTLRWYGKKTGIFSSAFYPHPLLCSPRGAISKFPDHMHEGEVIVPSDLSAKLTFGDKTFTEYPQNNASQTGPEIVAWGEVLPEKNLPVGPHSSDADDIAVKRSFGVVGAYDGHRESIGRVCVDSTWHHFFDINLIGDPVAAPPKTLGFNASASGQAVLDDIRSYYRNIGTWLARPQSQLRHFVAAAWFAATAQPLSMIVRGDHSYELRDLKRFGSLGLQSLYRLVPPCSVLVWFWPHFVEGPFPVVPPDPWAKPTPGDPVIVSAELFLAAALGGAVVELVRERQTIASAEGERGVEIAHLAVKKGIFESQKLMAREISSYGEGLVKFTEAAHERSFSGESPQSGSTT
ncbi:hypothetical protein [Paraburkholderia sediminicola]|uniref:hypothetical protein n=1 Tax=Paraburkholderia sediminicola TaxID=458836 RepID=UPI0038B96A59